MAPLDTVLTFLSHIEAKRFPEAVALVAADCAYTNIPIGTVRGPAGVLGALEPFFAPIVENEFRILRTAAQGATVFVERLDRHRGPHGWFELPVTEVFEVQDGRITIVREYFDLATIRVGMARGGAAAPT